MDGQCENITLHTNKVCRGIKTAICFARLKEKQQHMYGSSIISFRFHTYIKSLFHEWMFFESIGWCIIDE